MGSTKKADPGLVTRVIKAQDWDDSRVVEIVLELAANDTDFATTLYEFMADTADLENNVSESTDELDPA